MRNLLLNLVCTVALLLVSCSSGPSEDQLFQDYQARMCKEVKFKDVKKISKRIDGVTAEVIVNVTGDCVGKYDPVFFGGPCAGFSKRKGSNQTVERKMIYKKYDTGWKLKRIM